jgi:hypothetical protein
MLEQVLEMTFSSQIFLTPDKLSVLKTIWGSFLGTADTALWISSESSCVSFNFLTHNSNSHIASDRMEKPVISVPKRTTQAAIELLSRMGGCTVLLEEQVSPVLIP